MMKQTAARKCAEKTVEIIALLEDHGIRTYKICEIRSLDDNFGSVTLEIDLDFRDKNHGGTAQ